MTRAWILLKSGRRLGLLDPQPDAWCDEDLAIGLSRTYRWGGYSAWDLPLSVAQHSLAVLALREADGPLTPREALREILHDATEALAGGFDCLAPLKPHFGAAFARLDALLQAAVDQRYRFPAWTDELLRPAQTRRPLRRCQRRPSCRRLDPQRDARQPRDHPRSSRQRPAASPTAWSPGSPGRRRSPEHSSCGG